MKKTPKLIEEISIKDIIYSQLWQRGEKEYSHLIFYHRIGQTVSGNYTCKGNQPGAIGGIAKWETEEIARSSHETYCQIRDTRKISLKGNQNASKGGGSGIGRVVVDLGELKTRAVQEANRREVSLKSVIVDALENHLKRQPDRTETA